MSIRWNCVSKRRTVQVREVRQLWHFSAQYGMERMNGLSMNEAGVVSRPSRSPSIRIGVVHFWRSRVMVQKTWNRKGPQLRIIFLSLVSSRFVRRQPTRTILNARLVQVMPSCGPINPAHTIENKTCVQERSRYNGTTRTMVSEEHRRYFLGRSLTHVHWKSVVYILPGNRSKLPLA